MGLQPHRGERIRQRLAGSQPDEGLIPIGGPAFVHPERYRRDVADGGVGLRAILRVRGFRLLLGTRLVGQAGDGLLESGLAAFVLFSPTSQPTPAKAALAFSILLLPYSVIGPFAGVLIDRWRRRSVLLLANVVRAAWVVGLALIVARGHDDLLLAVWVLGLLGVNRFILAALSAGLPHVVAGRYLVTGNALAPTAGTVAWIVGGLGGLLLRHATGGGDTGAVIVLAVTVPVYLLAGVVASRLAPDELGPDAGTAPESIRSIASGMVAGVRHLAQRRPAARAIGLVTVHRAIFGAATLLTVLQARETLYPGDSDGAIAAIGVTSLAAGSGRAARRGADRRGCRVGSDPCRGRSGRSWSAWSSARSASPCRVSPGSSYAASSSASPGRP